MTLKKSSTSQFDQSSSPTELRAVPRALSITDAARSLGIGRTLLYELLLSEEIASVHIGRRRLILATEIDRFLASRMPKADPSNTSGGRS